MATNANVKKLVPQWATMTINNINEIIVKIEGIGSFAMNTEAADRFKSQLEAAIKAQKSNTDLGCWNEPTEAR